MQKAIFYPEMNLSELKKEYDQILARYQEFLQAGLQLDMSRGKPSPEQLDLASGMVDAVAHTDSFIVENGSDVRNYGNLDGIAEAKKLFSELLEVPVENVAVCGNSSVNLIYDQISQAMSHGICNSTPWQKLDQVKFLCPVPGYDRHFAICEYFGIEMIPVPLHDDGPDMELVKNLVESDESIKGIWCVPKYSNPTGITYSDAVVHAFASLKPKAEDFRIFWDYAYCVHDWYDERAKLLNIFTTCKQYGNEDLVYIFISTSKISLSGSGISAVAASDKNLADIKQRLQVQRLGFDRVNQLRHVRFFRNVEGIYAHMQKHRALMAPKFEIVFTFLDQELKSRGIIAYHKPKGGYFVSVNTLDGCAKRVYQLCKEAGVILTAPGATFPYGKDEKDANLRLAPSYPTPEELEKAMELFCLCVRLASLEKLLAAKGYSIKQESLSG
ncbi:MAG: aminotransferase class I/II-fold pyridoxal phosphate-dependent enzyme [Firmicutes bacterium]|nr:aminotransferase class I/II-fold pyridoxal phosphate-dependent enzyme [Bacillota bacterium]